MNISKQIVDQIQIQNREKLGQADIKPIKGFADQIFKVQSDPINLYRWRYIQYRHTFNEPVTTFQQQPPELISDPGTPFSFHRDTHTPWNSQGSHDTSENFRMVIGNSGGIVFSGKKGIVRAWGIRVNKTNAEKLTIAIGYNQRMYLKVWTRLVFVDSVTDLLTGKAKVLWAPLHDYTPENIPFGVGSDLKGFLAHIFTDYIVQRTPNSNTSGFLYDFSQGAEIWVTAYSPIPTDPNADKHSRVKIFPLNMRNVFDNPLDPDVIDPTGSNVFTIFGGSNFDDGGGSASTSTIDTKTRNIINKVSVRNELKSSNIKQINLYRSTSESIGTVQESPNIPNAIYIDGNKKGNFVVGTEVTEPNNKQIVDFSYSLPENLLRNGDFAWHDGSNFSNWTVNDLKDADIGDRSTALQSKSEPLFNQTCLEYRCVPTINTAKSFFVESDFYSISTANINIEFHTRLLSSTADNGYLEARVYSRNSETSTVSSIIKSFNTSSNNWHKNELIIDKTPSPTYLKLRFYLATSDFGAYRRTIDGVKVYRDREVNHFSTANSALTYLQLCGKFEKNRTPNSTKYHSYLDTGKSYDGQYPATYSGPIIYINDHTAFSFNESTSKGRFSKFNKGIQISEPTRNQIVNGDFSGPATGGFAWSFLSGQDNFTTLSTPSWAIFGKNVGHLFTTASGGESLYTQSDFVSGNSPAQSIVSSAFCLSLWARAEEQDTLFKMKIRDNRPTLQSSEAVWRLTDDWHRYSVTNKFTNSTNTNLISEIGIVDQSTPSSVYIDGVQLEGNRGYHTPFNVLDTGASAIVKSAQRYVLSVNSANAIFDQSYGTVRLWYTPDLRYDSAIGKDRILWHRENFLGGPQVGCRYINNATGKKFEFYQFDGTSVTTISSVSGIYFADNDPIHIVCMWNTDSAWMYANSAKSTVNKWQDWATSNNVIIGADISNQNQCNGVISNLMIDQHTWGRDDVLRDFYSERLRPQLADTITRNSMVNVGSRKKKGIAIESNIIFEDNNSLDPSSSYNYYYSVTDSDGHESNLNFSTTLTTTAMPDLIIKTDKAAARLIAGNEVVASSFVELKPDGIRYHLSGMPASDGFSFTKHVESGSGFFGQEVAYSHRFANWDGVPVNPHLIYFPKFFKTFDRNDFTINDTSQSIEMFIQQSTPGGHQINANLYSGAGGGTSIFEYDSGHSYSTWDGSAVQLGGLHTAIVRGYNDNASNIINCSISTVIPGTTSKDTGILYQWKGRVDAQFKQSSETLAIRCYANNSISTSYGRTGTVGWNFIQSKNVNLQVSSVSVWSIFIGANLDGARSLAFELSTPAFGTGPAPSPRTSYMRPTQLWVVTTNPTIISSGAALGAYNWTAIDGGLSS